MNDEARTGGLEQTILPSPHVTLLAPDAREVYSHRLADVTGTAAEQYQVNSRLRPWELAGLPSEEEVEAVRRWFLQSGRDFAGADLVPGAAAPRRPFADLPAPLAALFGRLAGPMATSLYVADLIVAFDDGLWLLPPGGDALVAERRQSGWRARMTAAVPPALRGPFGTAAAVVAVVCVPWRTMTSYGERGYRRALMETGVLVSNVCGAAVELGLRPYPVLDYVDTDIDTLLGDDGVERFCAALVPLTMPGSRR